MRVVVDRDGREDELELDVLRDEACVADLLAAVDPVAGALDAGVVVDGRFHDADTGLDELGLHDGAVLQVATSPPAPALLAPDFEVAVVAGPDAGRRILLDDGDVHVIGRDADVDVAIDDPTLSARHAQLERDTDGGWRIRDLGSSNGTWVDGQALVGDATGNAAALVRLGAVHLQVRRVVDGDELRTGRRDGVTTPFNRPPRPGRPPDPPDLAAPEPPQEAGPSRAFSLVALIGPVVLGVAMILITRRPMFALFLLLSPVMLVGNHLAGKRRARKEAADSDRRFQAALRQLRSDLDDRGRQATARLEDQAPDLAEVVRRAQAPSVRLWERRADHDDFLQVRLGTGAAPWRVPIEEPRTPLPQLDELRDACGRLPRAPVTVDLAGGGVVGLVGDRTAALATARALLLQLTVHHGPADLQLLVAGTDEATWDWTKWLPHARDDGGTSTLLSTDRDRSVGLLQQLVAAAEAARAERLPGRHEEPSGPVRCLVVDDLELLAGRRAPARLVLSGVAGPVTGIVLADREEQLPAVCDTVVECHSPLGDAELRRPQQRLRVDDLTVAGASERTAREVARALARFEDPELAAVGAGVPRLVRLLPLLGLEEVTAERLRSRWAAQLPDPALRTPIGRGEDGPLELDLVTDGPHGLIGGTTGSGKSELLRSLVAGLAATVGPDHLVFVLVDYKGGSAFDVCAELPHTVGMVTDLDDHLGERALRSLEAELHHRERVLRDAGAQDLTEYRRLASPAGPLPRLVVVIDEFATLASELPDFLGALVGIAQRGRSLGVHLLLATQRPRGAVDGNVRANTNLRIALRVQDASDSSDIIDTDQAAALSRTTPGRAYVRLGPGDLALVQTPLSTVGGSARRVEPLRVRPFRLTPQPPATADGDDDGPSDLARLVAAARDAADGPPPRRPWLPMLGEDLDLTVLLDRNEPGDELAEPIRFALADDPDHQRQRVVGWDPRDGHLALYGMVGAGTTTAACSVVAALAASLPPSRAHVYALDFGAGELDALQALPHVGAVVGATDREGQHRLVRTLRRELDRRRDLPTAERLRQPDQVVVVDQVAGFLAEHEGLEGAELLESFQRLFAEGPTVGITFVVTGTRPGALPLRMASQVSQRWLLRLAEPNDFAAIGLRARQVPTFVPGRAVRAEDHLVVQVGRVDDLATFAAGIRARWADDLDAGGGPQPVTTLPRRLELAAVPGGVELGRPLRIPLGVDDDLAPAVLELHPGEHAAVVGPPRSGRSSLLRVVAQQLRAADPQLVLVGVCDARSPLFGEPTLDAYGDAGHLASVLRAAPEDTRPWVVLLDDVGGLDDEEGLLAALVRSGRDGLHAIGAGRTDELGSDYGRWTRALRRSRTGVLLQPNLTADGPLLGATLPRRIPTSLGVGRGFLVTAGAAQLAQFALPDETPHSADGTS